jgi:hypothetical protein
LPSSPRLNTVSPPGELAPPQGRAQGLAIGGVDVAGDVEELQRALVRALGRGAELGEQAVLAPLERVVEVGEHAFAGEGFGDAVVGEQRRELRPRVGAAQHHRAAGGAQALVGLHQDARARAVELGHARDVEGDVAHAVGHRRVDAVVQHLRGCEEERPLELHGEDRASPGRERRGVDRLARAPATAPRRRTARGGSPRGSCAA